MAEQKKITVEELSPTPLQLPTEEESQETPEVLPVPTQPQAEDVGFAVSPNAVSTEDSAAETPGVKVEILPGDYVPSAKVEPEVKEPQPMATPFFETIEGTPSLFDANETDIITAGANNAPAVSSVIDGSPLIPPGRFDDLAAGKSKEEARAIRKKVSEFYAEKILGGNGDREKRMEVVNEASYYRIPSVDERGNLLYDEDNKIAYDSDPIVFNYSNPESRLIQMFELNPSPNGIYHFFNGDPTDPELNADVAIDTGYLKMRREGQSELAAFFYRIESEEGGMKNYMDILNDAGITDVARLTSIARDQINAGPFGAIERFRMRAGITDTVKFLADVTVGEGFKIPFTDTTVGLGAPFADLTAGIPFYLYEAAALPFTFDPFSEVNPMQEIRESDIPKRIREIGRGRITPIQIDDAVTRLMKEYPDATNRQIEAILMYSPDLAAITKRFAVETALTGGGYTLYQKGLVKAERSKFIEYVKDVAGDQGIEVTDLSSAMVAINRKDGMEINMVVSKFYEDQGLPGAVSNLIARAIDQELADAAKNSGPFFEEVIAPQLKDATEKLQVLKRKLEGAKDKNSARLIETYSAQIRLLEEDVLKISEKSYVPAFLKSYLKDEGIATAVAATAYQAVYNVAGQDPTTSSIAAFLFSVTSALPGVRRLVSNGVEDVQLALSSNLNSDTSKAAIKLRRVLEEAPVELRENVLVFMEKKAIAIEELSELKYPATHPKAGQPVVDPDLLDQSFAQMSGLVSLRRMEAEIMKASVNIQTDVGRLSPILLELERSYTAQSKLIDSLAKSIEALRFYRASNLYDPSSDSGKMLDTLVSFYNETTDQLQKRRSRLDEALVQRDVNLSSFFDGTVTPKTLEDIFNDNVELSSLIALDHALYIQANVPPNAGIAEQTRALQDYFVLLNKRVTDQIERTEQFQFESAANTSSANNVWRSYVSLLETKAYKEASLKFDELRDNKLYSDLRMDLTEVLEAFVNQGSTGGLGIDTAALAKIMPIYGEGTVASRALAKKNLSPSENRALAGLFNESAGEYLQDLNKRVEKGTLESIYEKAGIDDSDSNIDKWYAIKDYFDENKAEFGNNFRDIYPRLGVDATTFMHIVSSLGKRGKNTDAIASRQLRVNLLNRAANEFFESFYAPRSDSSRTANSEFAKDYEAARRFFVERYITPFREQSSVVASLSKKKDTVVNTKALDAFLQETGAAKPDADFITLRENFYSVIEGMTGGPIDISTDIGKQLRIILTKHVYAEIATTPGAQALAKYLLVNNSDSSLIIPGKFSEINASFKGTPLLDNLLRKNTKGEYLFADVNGEPLVNPNVLNILGFDELLAFGVREATTAQANVWSMIRGERNRLTAEFNTGTSTLKREVDARLQLVTSLRVDNKGLGGAFYNLTRQEGGAQSLAQLRDDFIFARTTENPSSRLSSEQAGALFDEVARDSVLDYIMNEVMEPGVETPTLTLDAKTGERVAQVHRSVELNLNKLASLFGIRGDTLAEAPQAKAMRELLGKETTDHIKFVFETLFKYDPRTGALDVTGTSLPLSAESMLSRGTSYMRGVISARWLISEAAIRGSREANYQLTKLMLGDPAVGREVLNMVMNQNFNMDKVEPEFVNVLISQIAKFDALQQLQFAQSKGSSTEPQGVSQQPTAVTPVDQQMNSLISSP